MTRHRIAWMPGDGIGHEVMEAGRLVLESLDVDVEIVPADIGWEFWCSEGDALPKRTLELLRTTKCAVLGAVTSKPSSEAQRELRPELQGRGLVYESPIIRLRQLFELASNIRPCRTFPGVPTTTGKDIDIVVFRENTEGTYSGVEFFPVPEAVCAALDISPKMARFRALGLDNIALTARIMSRQGCASICRAAFEYAEKHSSKKVTLAEKPNVLRQTGGLMTRVFREVAASYPDIPTEEANIDALCMHLVMSPETFDVIVAENMFGDIISDLCAGLTGGLGLASAANVGTDYAIFEPSHGSAPDIAGRGVANPVATFLAIVQMLDWIGESSQASRLERAVETLLRERRVGTFDMGLGNSTLEVAQEMIQLCLN
ncbi:MAG: isocitrate/isopropylmalate dehydrogenase family protein [Proteobacteria bacterium]|nr:isocitrate/isopropylmalate dehydrogenase family protein [Pseudomonadota bacterium]